MREWTDQRVEAGMSEEFRITDTSLAWCFADFFKQLRVRSVCGEVLLRVERIVASREGQPSFGSLRLLVMR